MIFIHHHSPCEYPYFYSQKLSNKYLLKLKLQAKFEPDTGVSKALTLALTGQKRMFFV